MKGDFPYGEQKILSELSNVTVERFGFQEFTDPDNVKPEEKKEQILKWAHLNPGGKRNLQDPKNKMSIIPDQKLKKLLGYDKYIKEVNDKKVFKNITNKDTGRKEKVLVTDPILSYSVIQKLIQHQILETNTKKDNDFEILS
jgi:chromatin remodeling complex protein RSC6